MDTIQKHGLRYGHPTAWKFRHWSAPETGTNGLVRLQWHSGFGEHGQEFDKGPLKTDSIVAKMWNDAKALLNNLADEGEVDMLAVYFDAQAVRPNLYVRGYNDTVLESDTQSDLSSEVSGTGYAALDYVRNTDWTPSGSTVVGAEKTWTAGAGGWSAMTDITLNTTSSGTAGELIAYVALSATRTLADGETLDLTPTVTMT